MLTFHVHNPITLMYFLLLLFSFAFSAPFLISPLFTRSLPSSAFRDSLLSLLFRLFCEVVPTISSYTAFLSVLRHALCFFLSVPFFLPSPIWFLPFLPSSPRYLASSFISRLSLFLISSSSFSFLSSSPPLLPLFHLARSLHSLIYFKTFFVNLYIYIYFLFLSSLFITLQIYKFQGSEE